MTHPELPPEAWQRRVFSPHAWPLEAGDTAVHEAGHLIAARFVGLPYQGAVITPDGSGRACLFTSPPESVPSKLPAVSDADVDLFDFCQLAFLGIPAAEAALRYVVMLVAGRQAELLHAGIELPSGRFLRMHDPDHLQARELLEKSGQRLALGWAQRQARTILGRDWHQVEAIARELRATGKYHTQKEPT